MLVKEWMTKDPVTVSEDTPIIEAYRILHEYEFRHVPVTRANRVVGIVSSRDIGERILDRVDRGQIDAWGSVSEIMTRDVHVTSPDAKLEEAALLMHNKKIGALPVVASDRALVGIVTTNDLLEALAATLAAHD